MSNLLLVADRATQQKYKRFGVFLVLLLLGMNYLLHSFFQVSQFKNYVRLGLAIAMVLYCVLRFWARDLRRNDFILFACAAVVLLLNGMITFNLAFLLILIIVLQGVRINQLFSYVTVANMVLLVVVLGSLALGIVDNSLYSVGDRHRITLGFANVNGTGVFAFSLISLFFLSTKKIQGMCAWLFVSAALLMYVLTDSRTMLLAAAVLFIAWLLIYRLPKKNVRMITFVVAVLMFIVPFIWGIPFLKQGKLNVIMSLRPQFYFDYVNAHSVLNFLFGGSQVPEIDNSYLLLLYNGGIFVYAAVAVITVVALDAMIREDHYKEVSFCLAMLVYGQLEGTLVRPEILCVPVFGACIVRSFKKSNLIKTAKDVRRWFVQRYNNVLMRKNEKV